MHEPFEPQQPWHAASLISTDEVGWLCRALKRYTLTLTAGKKGSSMP